jgi:hypothetical protein
MSDLVSSTSRSPFERPQQHTGFHKQEAQLWVLRNTLQQGLIATHLHAKNMRGVNAYQYVLNVRKTIKAEWRIERLPAQV